MVQKLNGQRYKKSGDSRVKDRNFAASKRRRETGDIFDRGDSVGKRDMHHIVLKGMYKI